MLSGSVPPGVNKDIYAVMTTMANEASVKVILDASGELLLEGVKARPYLIKPNKEEFEKSFGCIKEDKFDELLGCGVKYICLSLGSDGAQMISKEGICSRPAILVPIRSLQGAGDAMVAGLCKAIYEKKEEKMLDYALNMAASTIKLEGTQLGDKVE